MVSKQKIRVIMKAYDHRLLDIWVREIINAAERTGAKAVSYTHLTLPTIYSV